MKKIFINFLFLSFISITLLSNISNKNLKNSISEEDSKKQYSCCYDLIIIGGGSSGFAAAYNALRMKKKVLIINDGLPIGGTCVNVGCIPSKYMVRAAESYHNASRNNFPGIKAKTPALNFKQLIKAQKDFIYRSWKRNYENVDANIDDLDIIKGMAKFKTAQIVKVSGREFTAKKIIIATGCTPKIPHNIEGLDKIKYYTHRQLYKLEKKPIYITIVGTGYIGLETASIYSQFGCKVTLISKDDKLLSKHLTKDLSDEIEKQLKKLGVEIKYEHKIEKVEQKGDKLIIFCNEKGYNKKTIQKKGILIIATGLKPNTEYLNAKEVGIHLDPEGQIIVNDRMETNIPNIFASGDCNDKPKYVYTASKEGKVAAFNAFAKSKKHMKKINYNTLPWVVFTNPEISGVGLDERGAERLKISYKVKSIPYSYLAKSAVSRDDRGMIKLILNSKTNKIIGARAICLNASDLITTISFAIKKGITEDELRGYFYPYLTLSDGLKQVINEG